MASIAEKKAMLILSDGASVNLNKPIDIPDSVTDIVQITESGWYHGKFTFKTGTIGSFGGLGGVVGGVGNTTTDKSTILNTPAMKIKDSLTVNTEYNFDVLVTKTGDYIFNFVKYLFYGVVKTNNSINWEIVSPLVVDDLTSTSSNKALSANQGKVLKDIVDGLNNEYGTKIKIGDDFDKIWKKGFYYTEAHNEGEILHAPETVIPSFDNGMNSGMLFYVHPVIVNDAYDDTGDGNATKMLVIAHQYLLSYERANASEHLLQYAAYASRIIRVIVNIADGSVSEYQGCNSEQDWRVMVADNLTTNDSSTALSAAQGKVLNDKISNLIKTDTVGSAANPVYMKNGTITAGTYTFSASTTDLTAGTSTLATNEIRFIYE